jgi:uncharacterized protein
MGDDMRKVNAKLEDYINKNVFPEYTKNENAHGIEHIKFVIERSFEIADVLKEDLNYDIIYTVASFHDLAHHISPEIHEKLSAEIMSTDQNLKEYFNEEELRIIKEAIEDHRASLEYEPRNIYGKIISSADRNVSVDKYLERAYSFNKGHYPEKTKEEHYSDIYNHAIKKFGRSGYATTKYYFEDTRYQAYLNELQDLIDNKDKFYERLDKVIENLHL